MKKQNFITGSVILAVSAIITKLIGAFFRIPLATLLGGSGMGYFSCAYGIFLPFYAVTAAGLPSAAARMVSEDLRLRGGVSVGKIKRTAVWLFGTAGIAGSLLIAVCAYPFCRYAADNLPALPAVIAIAPAAAAGCICAVLRGCYEGMNNMYPTALSLVAESIAKLVCGLAGAYFVIHTAHSDTPRFLAFIHYSGISPDVDTLADIYAAAAACVGVSLSCFAGLAFMILYDIIIGKKSLPVRIDIPALTVGEITSGLLSTAVPAALCALVTNITSMIDLATVMQSMKTAAAKDPAFFSGYGLTAEEIPNFFYGCFSGLAITVFNLVPSVTNMFGRSLMPSAAAAYSQGNKSELARSVREAVYLTAAAAVPCGAGITFLAAPILSLLFADNTSEIKAAAPALAVLGIGMVFLCVSSVLFTVFQAAGRADIPVKLMAVGTVVKAVGNILLVPVPQLNITGAAISTDISYLVILILSAVYLRKIVIPSAEYPDIAEDMIMFVLCGLLCGVTANGCRYILENRFGNRSATVCGILCGAVFYIISTYFSGIIAKTPLKMLISEKNSKNT